jgi:hypothetical protein
LHAATARGGGDTAPLSFEAFAPARPHGTSASHLARTRERVYGLPRLQEVAMKAPFAVAAICALLALLSGPIAAQTLYPTPQRAASQCKGPVVWLNLSTRVFSMPGQRDYGNTPNGAYVCRYAVDKTYVKPVLTGH